MTRPEQGGERTSPPRIGSELGIGVGIAVGIGSGRAGRPPPLRSKVADGGFALRLVWLGAWSWALVVRVHGRPGAADVVVTRGVTRAASRRISPAEEQEVAVCRGQPWPTIDARIRTAEAAAVTDGSTMLLERAAGLEYEAAEFPNPDEIPLPARPRACADALLHLAGSRPLPPPMGE